MPSWYPLLLCLSTHLIDAWQRVQHDSVLPQLLHDFGVDDVLAARLHAYGLAEAGMQQG